MEDDKNLFLQKSKELDNLLEKSTKLRIEHLKLSGKPDSEDRLYKIKEELKQLQNQAVKLFRS
ncbi:MAG: hypothetical protein N4A68_11875 [Maledivibacter sp.]|nr:hypothetical protein [Maledivibacter sp.]